MSAEDPDNEQLAGELTNMLDAVDPMTASLPDRVRDQFDLEDPDRARR